MSGPDLKQFQSLMEHSLLSPTLDEECQQLMTLFKPQGDSAFAKAEAELRLAIYRNNVMHSLTEALGELYPVVKRLIGDDCFKGAAIDYVRENPPQHAALLHYGESFSQFLGSFKACQALYFLPDVAKLEFLYNQAYHGADGEVFDPQSLSAVPPEMLGEVSFETVPSLILFNSEWPVDEIWRQNQGEEPEIIDLDQAQAANLAIFRQELAVQIVNLDINCYQLLWQLHQGETISHAWQNTCGEAQKNGREIEESELGAMLSYLFSLDVFTAFNYNDY